MKRIIFLDRDGTLIVEPQDTLQADSLDQMEFLPGVFRALYQISTRLDYMLVIVSNQDGLGTDTYPEENYNRVQGKLITFFRNEGIEFDEVLIDRSWPEENSLTRKPKAGLLSKYLNGEYDLAHSWIIGDRITDMELARNIGAQGILIGSDERTKEVEKEGLTESCKLVTNSWDEICHFLLLPERTIRVVRKTRETNIVIEINLDGRGKFDISTGLGFFDHMLAQVAQHGGLDLIIKVKGDLHVDEHHTIEDVALTFGEAIHKSIASKRGMERYGFILPMDDCAASVLIDFGGRSWIVWDVEFKREKIGEFPTEMFFHFFKSFSDACRCNLNIKATGKNEHHKAESIFKAFAKAIRMAIIRNSWDQQLPSTKGAL